MVVFKRSVVFFFCILTLLACSWALLHGGMFRIHDFTHAARIAELLRALQDGHFPVRWTSNFGFGYGMPLFEFYAPLPFYVGAVFYSLGLGLVPTIKILFLLSSLLTFIGTYLLGSRLFGRAGGILAAVAVTLAPYRAVNLFVRGAIGEAWGMMAIPWVLLGIVKVVRQERHGWVTLCLSLVVLFLSHNITTLLFLPISGVFALGYWWVEKQRQQAGLAIKYHQAVEDRQLRRSFSDWFRAFPFSLLTIYGLAIGLAAFYLFPAFLEKDFTKVNVIFEGYFHYRNHFLYLRQLVTPYWGYGGSGPGPTDGVSFFLGFGQILGVAIAALLATKWVGQSIVGLSSSLHSRLQQIFSWRVCLFGLLAVEMGFAFLMTVEKTHWLWDQIPFMVAVQFPWRWLAVAVTFLGLTIGAGTLFLEKRGQRYLYVLVLALIMIGANFRYFQPENFDDVSEGFYYADPRRIRHDMSRTLNDYIPVQMQLDPLSRELPPLDQSYRVMVGDPQQVKLLVDRTQEKLLQTQFSQIGKIEFAIADFPGWTVLLDAQPVDTQRTALGNILIEVPAGEHQVGVQFRNTPLRAWSDGLSALSWLLFVSLIIWQQRKAAQPIIL